MIEPAVEWQVYISSLDAFIESNWFQSFDTIPTKSLTHAYFSFGYITPGDFRVTAMDDLPASLFEDFTNIKTTNSALKTVIALGGWVKL